MENMDEGLTVPKWVLILWPKFPLMPQNLSVQFVCPSPKVLDFIEKRLHWVSEVRGFFHFSISKKKAKSHSQTYFKRPKYKPIYFPLNNEAILHPSISMNQGTFPILRQQNDWVGGVGKWPCLLMFSTVFMGGSKKAKNILT